MAVVKTTGARVAGVCTCVPTRRFDNLKDASAFTQEEIRKVTGMAGVSSRRVSGDTLCSSDLCITAAERLMERLDWATDSIDAVIMVTQTPDYFLPSTACVVHHRLSLADHCAAFDVGLGCSGYPYGMWLAAMMLQGGGMRRVLVLHGETPTRFSDQSDRSVSLLFGDAGSATALEATGLTEPIWHYALHSDGGGFNSMIVESGGFRDRFGADARKHCVSMNGALIFNFTIKRVPALIDETLQAAMMGNDDVDYFIFHQSNQFIMKHLCVKRELPSEKVPIILRDFGNTGGASIPLTMTQGNLTRLKERPLRLMLLGYGVGLSWGSALIDLDPNAVLDSVELDNTSQVSM
ncbi:MAG TPA: ketoacyl-ACP synthase III [Nitrospira sp.]|nr:ketoacyl-ACP synthase III [Nitrospira sp.]